MSNFENVSREIARGKAEVAAENRDIMSMEKATGRGGVVRELVTAVPGIFRASTDRSINY